NQDRAAAAARDKYKQQIAERFAGTTGGRLEVVVGGRDAWWPGWGEEDGPGGKSGGAGGCGSTGSPGRTPARLPQDPGAPKDVRVTTQPGASADRTRAVVRACENAGFKSVQVTGRETGLEDRVIEKRFADADAEKMHLENLLKLKGIHLDIGAEK